MKVNTYRDHIVPDLCRLLDEFGELPGINEPVSAIMFRSIITAFRKELSGCQGYGCRVMKAVDIHGC